MLLKIDTEKDEDHYDGGRAGACGASATTRALSGEGAIAREARLAFFAGRAVSLELYLSLLSTKDYNVETIGV